MGQLLKIQDYVSRYEMDLIRYTNQFVRLKKQKWQKFRENWKIEQEFGPAALLPNEPDAGDEAPAPVLERVKHWFKKHNDEREEVPEIPAAQPHTIQFSPQLAYFPETEAQLKQLFLDQLFRFQLKWASSTLLEEADIPASYYFDANLKYFLQRFPDTFLLMYKPVFTLKKTVMEMETLFITPTAVWCLKFLEDRKDAVFLGSKAHFWSKRTEKGEKKILSPMIALDRTENIIRQILKKHGVAFPVEKGLICRNGYIDYPDAPVGLHVLDKRAYPEWFHSQRQLRSPVKYMQLKAAQLFMNECLSAGAIHKTGEHDEEPQRDGE
ncbi:hypothetical protein [Heyndrickxia acidiproducens]|uniref:hypothetical protein n=1 Tax=Heyndrickxia acidiproducens TaxID=1121084 RepID=UPI00036FC2FD|nr:hypothetical protein [Heyndrickxia acidiproducens]